MLVACVAVVLAACVLAGAQPSPTFDLRGSLKLVDLPPKATSVKAYLIMLHPQKGGFDIQARPDRHGNFVLKNLRPGPYALALPMPGRIVTFARGKHNLFPDGFRLVRGGAAPLRIVVSLNTSGLLVKIQRLPGTSEHFIALFAPADSHLTLRFSCCPLPIKEPETEFRHVPPGRFRVFIIDAQFQSKVAAYAPRFPDFLKNQATTVEVLKEGEAKATATFVDARTLQQAIQQAGPHS